MNAKDLIQIDGLNFIQNGTPTVFRGVNLGNWLMLESYMLKLPYLDHGMRKAFSDVLGKESGELFWKTYEDTYMAEADFAWLAELGINLVRIPFNYRILENDLRPGKTKERGFKLLDRALASCEKHGLSAQLDLHGAPGAQATDWNAGADGPDARLRHDILFQQRTTDLWVKIAKRYKDNPVVMGYCLINEPVCPDSITPDHKMLNNFYRRTIEAIRREDPHHIIVLEANLWGEAVAGLADDLFDDPQVTYQPHSYPVHQLPPDQLANYPVTHNGIRYDREWLAGIIEKTTDEQRIQRPLIFGEFGTPYDRDAGYELVADLIGLFEEKGWSWVIWNYKDFGDIGFANPAPETPWKQLVNRPDIQETQDEFRKLTDISFGRSEAQDEGDDSVSRFNPDWNKDQGQWVQQMRKLYPDVNLEIFLRAMRECQRNTEKIVLYSMVGKLKSLSRDELIAMATSFAFENCVMNPKALHVLRPFFERNRNGTGN